MHGTSHLQYALAYGRRVFLVLACIATAVVIWLYAKSPGLDMIRPGIERFLKQELALETLTLGNLSWRWSGFLWLQANQLEFSNRDSSLAFDGGQVAVRIPLLKLFSGDVAPDSIRITGGKMQIDLTSESAGISSKQLTLEQVAIDWRYGDSQGALPPLRLILDSSARSIKLIAPEFTLAGQLGQDGRPESLILHADNSNWLPESWLSQLKGSAAVDISVRRTAPRAWEINATAAADERITLMPDSIYTLHFNRMDAALKLKASPSEEFAIEHLEIQRLLWSEAGDSISVHGDWNAGLLSLSANTNAIAMPTIWSWLRPLGESDWHHWLSLMHQGTALDAHAELQLVWEDPLDAMPTSQAWEAMRYQVTASVDDLDLALGASEGYLMHTRGRVKLDQQGLDAFIDDARLPHELGQATGTLHIPWQTLDLHINGRSDVAMASLINWLGAEKLGDIQWGNAHAGSQFQMIWSPGESAPKQAHAQLQPKETWKLGIKGSNIAARGGNITWDINQGVKISGIQLSNDHINARLDLSATSDADNNWQVNSVLINNKSTLDKLAAHFQLPLSHPEGEINTRLQYNGSWQGEIDLGDSGWQQLLGSGKKRGEPYKLSFVGTADVSDGHPMIRISELRSQGSALLIRNAVATLDRDHLELNLSDLHTPSFSGALDIAVPFDEKAWQLVVNADYLNRNALPASLEHPTSMVEKRWRLKGRIARFDWAEARLQNVEIDFSSEKESVGTLSARQVSTSQLNIDHVKARFSMPGGGEIDLRHFSANIEKQQLIMSAQLKPAPDGGMLWSGFAELHGDFGQLMSMAEISKRFQDGDVRLLFSGRGELLRNQPWWQGLDGRLRLRSDKGRVLEGGGMTTLLAALNLGEFFRLFTGDRQDLFGPGIMYERLQMEAIIQNQHIGIHNVVMRASAFDLAGHGSMNLQQTSVDLYMVARPLQNLDALLARIPLVRDILGGRSHSLWRKVYHMQGPFSSAKVTEVKPGQAGMPQPGMIEKLFRLPEEWFEPGPNQHAPAPAVP